MKTAGHLGGVTPVLVTVVIVPSADAALRVSSVILCVLCGYSLKVITTEATEEHRGKLRDPAATDDDIVLIEHCRLTRCDGALRFVKRGDDLIITRLLDDSGRGLMPVANFY